MRTDDPYCVNCLDKKSKGDTNTKAEKRTMHYNHHSSLNALCVNFFIKKSCFTNRQLSLLFIFPLDIIHRDMINLSLISYVAFGNVTKGDINSDVDIQC